jgi:hypothetical protein
MNCLKCKWVHHQVDWDIRRPHCSHPSIRQSSFDKITGEHHYKNIHCEKAKDTVCHDGFLWAPQDTKRKIKNTFIMYGGKEFLLVVKILLIPLILLAIMVCTLE